jgi:hypothetical protein
MTWGALIICGLVLWGACGCVYALGREIWPAEMPEAVRLVVAPAVASAVTVADKIASPDLDALSRAAGFTLIVGVLDALVLVPLVDGDKAVLRSGLGFWAPLAAIFLATWITGALAPM